MINLITNCKHLTDLILKQNELGGHRWIRHLIGHMFTGFVDVVHSEKQEFTSLFNVI